eukprot:TRINITY_DN12167_c0_g1_i1.p1 TRINITY_DN12167_c0_g1~~TRINITY_DN12167_c0_g1_i1.p1  ORF type:complete len:429 (-),score=68.57 TRINITY_DN12167_c0_g1_i1:97-1362(-)
MNERTPLVGAQPVLAQQGQPSEVIISVDPSAAPKQQDESNIVWAAPPLDLPEPAAPQVPAGPLLLDAAPLTELDVKNALEEWATNKTKFRVKGIAHRLIFSNFVATNAYVVGVDSFVEGRRVIPKYKPYRGGPVDDQRNGPIPGAWQLPFERPPIWTERVVRTELPHAEYVECCFTCHGNGRVQCWHCHGHGETRCNFCHGTGHRHETEWHTDSNGHRHSREKKVHCHSCHHGYNRCFSCNGSGQVVCGTCQGARDLLHYKVLEVKWYTEKEEGIVKSVLNPMMKDVVPDKKISAAEGVDILREESVRVGPLEHIESAQGLQTRINVHVNTTCNSLLAKATYNDKLQHWQRLSVKGLPIYEVTYSHGDKQRHAWIVGTSRNVYAPNYPVSFWRVFFLVAGLVIGVGGLVVGLLILLGIIRL